MPRTRAAGSALRPVQWTDGAVRVLDQRRLPKQERYLECRTPGAVASAIRTLAVRGAPLIGIAGAYGVALAAARAAGRPRRRGPDSSIVAAEAERAGAMLTATRPTAVNLARGVGRVVSAARDAAGAADRGGGTDAAAAAAAALVEAKAIDEEERLACLAIGRLGRGLIPEGARVLTHCNTGTLATNWEGTAQAVITAAFELGRVESVWADETRPLLQGARLTAWELHRRGIPVTLLVDGAAGSLMARGLVDVVIVGADRIAANGDVANKVGTYPLSVLARRHGLPFLVAAPVSTVDLSVPRGSAIPIEERSPDEVTGALGSPVAPAGIAGANPAFDVTPGTLVTAIVTDRAVVRAPYRRGLASALSTGASR
jgi:methylthioribose-1-phosphate isomerase